jgi:hypothetical protein
MKSEKWADEGHDQGKTGDREKERKFETASAGGVQRS